MRLSRNFRLKVDDVLKADLAFFKEKRPDPGNIVEGEYKVTDLTSNALGLAWTSQGPLVIPFAVPGDTVTVGDIETTDGVDCAQITDIISPSKDRVDPLCKYFGQCAGCQLQNFSYPQQLQHKRAVLERAFAWQDQVDISHVIPSPITYHYRTKLTPHFDLPRNKETRKKPGFRFEIGFDNINSRRVMDIEECVIGTPCVGEGLKVTREKAKADLQEHKRGATLLVRESREAGGLEWTSNHKKFIKETVGDKVFTFPAGAFFQNNHEVLPDLVNKVKDLVGDTPRPNILIDAYCGAGLFSICLAEQFDQCIGIDIDPGSIKCASLNAKENNLSNVTYQQGTASDIFASIPQSTNHTTLIIDPPRKGCDEPFIKQLLNLKPQRIVYVSCNVHSQSRDIRDILASSLYDLKFIGGIDLFPQTYHVEGLAMLQLR